MHAPERAPWSLHRSWADPLLTLLLLSAFLLGSAALRRRLAPPPPASAVSFAGRAAELSLAAPRVLAFQGGSSLKPTDWARVRARLPEPWDRALVATLAVDQAGWDPALAEGVPPEFRATLAYAFGEGPRPSPEARAAALRGLGGTFTRDLLEARLLRRDGGSAEARLDAALARLRDRLLLLLALGLALLLLGLGGLAFALVLAFAKSHPRPPLPAWNLEGRALALILLGWFNALLLSGSVVAPLIALLPEGLKPLGLPLAYGFHAAVGLGLLAGFTGLGVRGLAARLCAGPFGRSLAWAAGHLGLAVGAVFLVALAAAPLLKGSQPAQRELLEFLGRAKDPFTLGALFVTVAVLAPVFEETLFRGLLLPWLQPRWGRAGALLASALLFGAIHLAPTGLPVLATLGLVLGLAFLRSGDLRAPILVHGCWNGAVFLFVRWLAG